MITNTQNNRVETEAEISRLKTLLRIATFMAKEHNLDVLLEYITNQVISVMECERCSIFLVDKESNEIVSRIATGSDNEIRFRLGEGIAGQTINTGQVISIPDAYRDIRFNKSVDLETGYHTRQILCVPLRKTNGEIIGCFQLINKLVGDFQSPDVEFLIAFGVQTASAIESAQLHESLSIRIRQMSAAHSLERFVAESETSEEFIQRAVQEAIVSVSGTAGSILMLEDDSRLVFHYSIGTHSEKIKSTVIESNKGIAGQVLATEKSIIDNNLNANKVHFKGVDAVTGTSTESIVATPLFAIKNSKKVAIGVLEVINHKSRRFKYEDLQILEVIGSQISSMLERHKLKEEQKTSQRLASVGQLASTIIHDFRNPFSIIRGVAELITLRSPPPEKLNDFCLTIIRQIDRCNSMAKEILEFTRGNRKFELSKIDIHAFFVEVAKDLQLESKGLAVTFHQCFECSGTMNVDAEKLRRVIFNIINNTFDALKAGQSLTLSTKKLDSKFFEIRMEDNGPGIPEAIRKNLFEPFVTHGKKGGTGLGLYIAKSIVEDLGGSLRHEVTVPTGATFIINLPFA
jgi:signal transduction histidine kinase